MIDPKTFLKAFKKNNFFNFVGIPDSLLKELLLEIDDDKELSSKILSNEGSLIAYASGFFLGNKTPPVIFMQNSGLGNAVNPLVSLSHKDVYDIPLILIIGWRGRPGFVDEPQHNIKGKITKSLLKTMKIKIFEFNANTNIDSFFDEFFQSFKNNFHTHAILIHEKTFKVKNRKNEIKINTKLPLSRMNAIDIIRRNLPSNIPIIATTGKASRELYMLRGDEFKKSLDFLTVGSMGHASMIALGLIESNGKNVCCIDGDGSLLMHMGNIACLGHFAKNNICYVLINNGTHESVGGQPVPTKSFNYKLFSKACGFKDYFLIKTESKLKKTITNFSNSNGSYFLEVVVNNKVLSSLPRPLDKPKQNITRFKEILKNV